MPKKLKGKGSTKAKASATAKKTGAAAQSVPPTPSISVTAPYKLRQTAPGVMFGIMHPHLPTESDASFPNAPDGWTKGDAEALAAQSGLTLGDDHWEVVRVLQGCYKDEVSPRLRLLHDALQARFAVKGGIRYLYAILPGGPIAQGCALAGLKAPGGARDLSFGSVA